MDRPIVHGLLVLALAHAATEAAETPETVSLLGQPLFSPELTPDEGHEREARLAEARAAYDADPTSVDATIWLGRRLAYEADLARLSGRRKP